MHFDKELDARGINSPLPILRARKALHDMAAEKVLKVVATDPGAARDFEVFALQTGYEMVGSEVAGKEYIFYMKKK